jgi:hypothetical protein
MKTTMAALGFLRWVRARKKHDEQSERTHEDEQAPSTRRRVAGAKVAGGDAVAAGEEKGRQTHAQGDARESDQGAFVCRDEI